MNKTNLILGIGIGAVVAYVFLKNKQKDTIPQSEPQGWWNRNIVYPLFYGYPSIIQVTTPIPPPPPPPPAPPVEKAALTGVNSYSNPNIVGVPTHIQNFA